MEEKRAGKWLYQCCVCYKFFMVFGEPMYGVACPRKRCQSFNIRLITGKRVDDHLRCELSKIKRTKPRR